MKTTIQHYAELIRSYILSSYKHNFREPVDRLKRPFLVPGAYYSHQLWDWDSWLPGNMVLPVYEGLPYPLWGMTARITYYLLTNVHALFS